MGNFLNLLRQSKRSPELNYLDCSWMKLREYYASFKLICDTFTIDSTQFSQIFGPSVNTFVVWDVEKRRKIDALEMFSGLVLFSNAKFQQKMQFLFEMFDLNEEGLLSFQSMQFMLVNCCNASYRIFHRIEMADDEDIELFLNEYFCSHSEISIRKLTTWASRAEKIRQYFQIINKEIPPLKSKQIQPKIEYQLFDSKVYHSFKNHTTDGREDIKTDYSYMEKFAGIQLGLCKTVESAQYFNPKPKWVYGMRIEDIPQPLHCIFGMGDRAANEKLLYFVGCVAIVYYPKLASQQFYLGHIKQISCLAVSKSMCLAATGEMSNTPNIHVWNIKTLSNVTVLNNRHRLPISHLLFFRNDKGLVSASGHQLNRQCNTSILVHSLEDDTVLFSCYIEDSVVSLINMNSSLYTESSYFSVSNTVSSHQSSTNNECEQCFLVLCQLSAVCYTLHKDTFTKHYFPLDKQPITCVLVCNNYGLALTGNNNGDVIKWKQFTDPQQLLTIKEPNPEIISMVQSSDPHLYCILTQSTVYIVSPTTGDVVRKIVPEELYQLRLVQILHGPNKQLLVLGLLGEMIQISLSNEGQFKRLPCIFRMDDIKSSYYSKQDNHLYLASSATVLKIDIKQNELCSTHAFDREIVCVAAGNKRIIVGLNTGQLLISHNHQIVERLKTLPACDLFINKNHVMVLNSTGIELYIASQGQYFGHANRKVLLDGYYPTRLLSTLNEKLYVVMTREGELLKVDLELKYTLVSSPEALPLSSLQGKVGDNPVLLSSKDNICITGNESGQLVFFNNQQEMYILPSHYHSLSLHASQISNLIDVDFRKTLDFDYKCEPIDSGKCFISVGTTDQMAIIWQNSAILRDTQGEPQPSSSVTKLQDILLRQLMVDYAGYDYEALRDSQLRISNILDKGIARVVQQILIPANKSLYQSQIEADTTNKRYLSPAASLKLSYVFGFESSNCRNSVAYCHVYYESARTQKNRKFHSLLKTKGPSMSGSQTTKSVQISEQLKAEMDVCQEILLPYTESHADCHKYLVYYSDRVCIRYCPDSKQQRFYDQHKNTITCLTVHPKKKIICSAESCNLIGGKPSNPKLHLWQCKSFETLKIFIAPCAGDIKHLEFSRDGKFIACIVKQLDSTSICVLDWLNDQWVGYRSMGNTNILDVKFDPYKRNQVAVCGLNLLRIYTISARTLIIKQQAIHEKQQVVTAITFISNSYGTTIESDIMTGNNHGDIGLFICGRYVTVKQHAHKGLINCLRVGELFKYKTVLVSAGEDQAVRIWDTKMNLISEVNLRSLTCLSSSGKHASFSPQSLDLYHCGEESSGEDAQTVLLVGTRNGDILQAVIQNEYRGLQLYIDDRKGTLENRVEGQKQRESISLKWNLSMRSYPSSSAVRLAIHKNKMATVASSHQLLLWDLNSKQITSSIDINGCPTTSTFNHTGDVLVLGYSTGQVTFYDVEGMSLTQFHQLIHPNYTVLKFEFAESDTKLAISMTPVKSSRQKVPYVSVLSLKGQQRKGEIPASKESERVAKLTEIFNRGVSSSTAASFMNFSCNYAENLLLLWYQPLSSMEHNGNERLAKYILWDMDKNQARKNLDGVEFNTLNFSGIVGMQSLLVHNDTDSDFQTTKGIDVWATNMTQISSALVMSSSNGQIVLARNSCFYTEGQQSSQKWAMSRTYKAHASQIITLLATGDNELYTGSAGNAIMKWVLSEESQAWQLDYMPVSKSCDMYEECLSIQRLDTHVNVLFPKRKNIFEVFTNQDITVSPQVDIKLRSVIGRSAFQKRSNILIDYNDTLISHAGCNVVLMHRQGEELRQQFMKVDPGEFSTIPQISTMSLSDSRRLLFIGTCEQNAKILTWDIGGRTCLFSIALKGIVEVRHLKANMSNTNIAAICLSTTNQIRLIYTNQTEVLASHNFDYSLNSKLHGVCFVPDESSKFVTCGLHHMVQWRYNCGLLNYQCYKMDDPNRESALINTYCFVFVRDNLVSGSDDGYLYVWQNKKIVKRQEAHPKQAILTLHCSQDSKIFASGGTDGKVILWQLSSNVMQKLFEYAVYEGPLLTSSVHLKHHVQSINIGSSKVIVGTRSGDIYEFERPGESDTSQQQQRSASIMLPAFDHEQIISIKFSPSSKNAYVLTKAGTLAIVELDTLKKKHECQVDLHDKQVLRMFVCQVTEFIILVFIDEIQVFDSLRKHNELLKITSCRFNRINDVALSNNERYLAVLLSENQTQNAKLLVYSLNIKAKEKNQRKLHNAVGPQGSETFTLYHIMENLSANIDFIDFSTDNEYLVFKNRDDSENIVVRLLSKQRINLLLPEFHIEWAGVGKKTLETVKAVTSFYNEDNKLLALAQLVDKCVVASDEMGSLRIYEYPVSQERGYSVCILEHLNNVNICVATPDCKILVTYSPVDRCINIWDISFKTSPK